MKKEYVVSIYATFRVPVVVEAEDHKAAIKTALTDTDLTQFDITKNAGMTAVLEYGDQITGFLVDEVGDPEYKNSRSYDRDAELEAIAGPAGAARVRVYYMTWDTDSGLTTDLFWTKAEMRGAVETMIREYWGRYFPSTPFPAHDGKEDSDNDLDAAWERLCERGATIDSYTTGYQDFTVPLPIEMHDEKLVAFASLISRMFVDGEMRSLDFAEVEEAPEPYVMDGDDAIETLGNLIATARELVKGIPDAKN